MRLLDFFHNHQPKHLDDHPKWLNRALDLCKWIDPCRVNSPHRILMISPANGGSTAVSRAFLQHPQIQVISSVMMIGRMLGYLRFYGVGGTRPFLFNKETLGPWQYYIHFRVFPQSTEKISLIFLYRDPVSVWNSWNNRGWVQDTEDITNLIDVFRKIDAYKRQAAQQSIPFSVHTFEHFTRRPNRSIKGILEDNNISFNTELIDDMVNVWKIKWGTRLGGRYDSAIYKRVGLGYANPTIDNSHHLRVSARPDNLSISPKVVNKIEKSEAWNIYAAAQIDEHLRI